MSEVRQVTVTIKPPKGSFPGQVTYGWYTLQDDVVTLTDREGIDRLASQGVVAFAMESIPRITRAQPMDALSSQANIAGYKAAYALIYEKGDYEAAIRALRALDHDDNADVANLIGYASRKLGRYDDAKVWYERSLAADPNHAVTWSYYGMWQAEQGNLLKAKDDLEKVRLICGTTCEPYKMLQDVIDGTQTY